MPPKKLTKTTSSRVRPKRLVNSTRTTSTQPPDQPQPDTSTNNNAENWIDMDGSESSSTEIESNTNIQSKSKPKLQIFKGFEDRVSIENWLKRFEMIAKYYSYTNKDKVVMLGNYLEDDALNWYIENSNDFNFDNLKVKLIARFGIETVEPIVEFFNLKYDIKSGIKEYFESKRRYGNSAKLTEQQMIPIMIQGLHPKMIDSFVAVKPQTFSEFYTIAKTAENNFKRNSNFSSKNVENRVKNIPNNEQTKIKKKPPNPCKICEGLGHKNRFHWAQDCRNKSTKTNTNTVSNPKINVIQNETNNALQSENDINKIDLN